MSPRVLAAAAVGALLWTVPTLAPDAPGEGAAELASRLVETDPVVASFEPTTQSWDDFNADYDGKLHFVRVRYDPYNRGGFGGSRRGRGREEPWHHDYPRAELNFMSILDEITLIGPLTDGSNILPTDDQELFKYPIAYIVEVGYWNPSDPEVEGLRNYLLKGGFLIVDDFRDQWTLDNFEFQMKRVLPDGELVLIDGTHEIFDSFFRIDPDEVIPPYGRNPPAYVGIFEDNDRTKRLQVVANYNNDIAEYWEFSDRAWYPIDLSNEAYKLGVNYIVYGLTH